MRKIKFGVIGLKGIGQTHISQITTSENCELAAVSDINEEIGKIIASKYNVKWYKNYENMLEEKDLDAVSVCTPHFLHFPMTMRAFEYDKHVLVEKPMALTVKEADQMIEEARRKGLKLGVVYQMRTNPVYRKMREMIDEDKIGKVYRICMEACVFRTQAYYKNDSWRGRWMTEGGGALINQTIHYIDVLQWLVGRPVKVYGDIGTLYHDIEVEDIASANLIFEGEARGVFQVSTVDPINTIRIEICGEKGKIISEDGNNEIRYAILDKSLKEYILDESIWPSLLYWWNKIEVEKSTFEHGHKRIIEDFAQAIIEDREPLVNGEEGRVSLEIVNAIILSSFQGKPIKLPVDREAYEKLLKERLAKLYR